MYRRNIAPLLYKIAFVVGLFILYEAWMKPTYLHQPQAPAPSLAPDGTVPEVPSSRPADIQEPMPRQTRLIDPATIPDTKHHEMLASIREELEKGNVALVESRLDALPSSITSDQILRRYVAILWNNVGIEQEKTGGTSASVRTFKKAAALDPNNPVIQLNLAHAYWELRDPAMTVEFLERLAALAPDEAFSHLALAELLRDQDDLKEAARHFEMATARAAKDPAAQAYFRTVASKLRRTEEAEERFQRRDSAHFTVKFDGEADQATWTVVQDILEDAYREIGQKLGHFPSKSIVVVLHTKATFQSATGSPIWADGLYDAVLGRIQIPSQGALVDRAWLRRVLRHELAHALLSDLQGSGATAIPTWLNEGLAMQLSGEQWDEVRPLKHQDMRMIPLTALEGSWASVPADAASAAYLEASSAVDYLIDRYGQHAVNQLLAHLKARQTLAAAMQSQLSVSYEQFQSRWLERFATEIRKG
ncbi:MAG TPA: peptidase MA family metallohydrolase [Nitrospira sp.]|nr:peptidase MA family metallohydrolase [Nitrospira sp.]